jgi:hypothetical protein
MSTFQKSFAWVSITAVGITAIMMHTDKKLVQMPTRNVNKKAEDVMMIRRKMDAHKHWFDGRFGA